VSYVRPDKDFESVFEQVRLVNAYVQHHNLFINKEMIDQVSQSRRIYERDNVVSLFRSLHGDTVLIYDLWTLSVNIEDVVQMVSCLLKNDNTVHLVKQGVIINRHSDTLVVLGLIDTLRQIVQNEDKRSIGRPRGSKSVSKFDMQLDTIVSLLKEGNSVSEISRKLQVSRSSLKDYVSSRELKILVSGAYGIAHHENAEAMVIETIKCPEFNTNKEIA
jgi:DNA invertase Pin-like site-specific DNA recombinase